MLTDRKTPADIRRTERVSVLGSTGSVGRTTLDLLSFNEKRGENRYRVVALTANTNVALLAQQARRFRPEFVAVADADLADDLRRAVDDPSIETGAGTVALEEAASRSADWVMAAIVGIAGLGPTLCAAEQGARIALANKESLVCAGDLLMETIRRAGGVLLPVDSEHNAIFQVFDSGRPERVSRLVLTASGGPFRTWDMAAMDSVTPAQALAHPNWSMGAKISVDSATMMNKGLELIEAARIFPVPHDRIDILVHPQSVVHSMVEYVDGSVLAQMGSADMCIPVASALAWPDRMKTPAARLDLVRAGSLTFEEPDYERFFSLRLAREAIAAGGVMPVALNAANEVAVGAFLDSAIRFTDIPRIIEKVLCVTQGSAPVILSTPEAVMDADSAARRLAEKAVAGRAAA